MIPPAGFVLGGAAALLVTFIAIALQWPWPGLYGLGASAAWAAMQIMTSRMEGVELPPGRGAQMLAGGGVVFLLSLLIP